MIKSFWISFRYFHGNPQYADHKWQMNLQALITACEEQNADSFTDAVRDYDKISRLDQWYTSILLRIKKSIEGDDSLL